MCSSVLRLCDCIILYFYQWKFNCAASPSMLTLEERINVIELLSGMPLDDLLAMASTTTKGLLKPNTREEANAVIIQHSESVESILNRKKISKELMFNYLHWKKVTTDCNLDKKSLTNLLIKYWDAQLPAKNNGRTNVNLQTPPREENPNIINQENNQHISTQLVPGQVNLLAQQFTEWFYKLLNKDFLEGGNFALGPENFWSDASLHIQLNSNGDISVEEAEGSTALITLLSEIKQRHKLYFSPNLSAEGVQGRLEPHGMVSVLVCGTLHQSAGVVVGLFEQIFYLIKDPLTNDTWKIKRIQLVLTSKSNVAALPTLGEGQLTRPLLPIENPD